jgi:hypothetical protein
MHALYLPWSLKQRRQHKSIIPKQLGSTKNGEVTLSQESYPTLTSVLLTLQVVTSGYVITSQASNDC